MYTMRVVDDLAQLEEIFRLRHRVFVEQEGVMRPRPDGRILDERDGKAGCWNILVRSGSEPVASVRVTAGAQIPDFDMRSFVPEGPSVYTLSRFCVDRGARGHRHLTGSLVALMYRLAHHLGGTHVVAVANPAWAPSLIAQNWEPVAEPCTIDGLKCQPLRLELASLALADWESRFLSSLTFGQLTAVDYRVLESGEHLIHEGEGAEYAFVLVSGRLAVHRPSGAAIELAPGALVGEMGVLHEAPRNADVVALETAIVMELGREMFKQQLARLTETRKAVEDLVQRRLRRDEQI